MEQLGNLLSLCRKIAGTCYLNCAYHIPVFCMINFGSVVKYGLFNNFLYQNNGAEVGMLWNENSAFQIDVLSGNRTVSRLSNSFKLFSS